MCSARRKIENIGYQSGSNDVISWKSFSRPGGQGVARASRRCQKKGNVEPYQTCIVKLEQHDVQTEM